MLFGQPPCPDCEPAQVNHAVIRTGSYLGLFLKPLLRPIDALLRTVTFTKSLSPFDRVGPFVLRSFAALRIGTLDRDIREADSDRTRALVLEAKRRGIEIQQFRLGLFKDLFIASYNNRTRCFDGLPRPLGREAKSLSWMDNKAEMRNRFKAADIPIARGGSVFREQQALRLFRSLRAPVIVKPYSGSRSRHTTIHINTEKELMKAFRLAKKLSPLALIEEELEGMVFRGTLIGGKLIAAMRREPPHVIGDGRKTVRALVETENARSERQTKTFHPIATGPEAEAELSRQKFTWESVPAIGQFVILHSKISRGLGASTTDVTDLIHQENRALLEKIGTILQDPLVGVDFIMNDITKPWHSEPRAGVIECNSLPFIDLHHYPLNGKPRNVAGALWNLIFPQTAKG